MAVNKVILMGNLGKDPIVRKFDNGRAVASFSLATTEKYKDKTGTPVSKTEWHNVEVWSPLAEIAEKYLKKGNQVYIEGKIESREYTDKEGVVKRATNIIGRELNLVGSPSAGGGGGYNEGNVPTESESDFNKNSEVPVNLAPSGDDDLPF